MPGRQAHGRSLLGGSKPAPKPNKKSKQKVRARALDAFGIASEQYPTKEKRTPRFRDIDGEVGQKHRRDEAGDDEEDEDEDDEDDQPRRKKVKASSGPARDAGDSDEFGSDSEGNEWRYGVGEDDDSEIDSDDAFGESDQETAQGFSFSGSKKKAKKQQQKEDDSDEEYDDPDDFDAGDDGEALGDEAIDLAQALDEAEDESDELEEGEGSDEEGSEEDDDSTPASSDDEDPDDEEADPSKMDALQTFISGFGGDEDEDAQAGSKKRQKITFKDLGLAGVKDPQMKKSMKLMNKEEKETRPGATKKLGIPLSQRQQDKITRTAAYDKTKETLDRWTETVKQNRRAEHLVFPLPQNAHDEGLNHDELQPITAKNPGNELESTIMSIMTQSGLAVNKEEEGRVRAEQEAEESGLSKEALKELVNQKRRERELNSREAKRQKRIKKIKSKAYHRVQRKARERDAAKLHEAMLENGEIDSEAEQEAHDRARALERMGARHRESRWAKAGAANKRAVWDDDYRAGLTDMAKREEELRRRKEGRAGGSSDDDSAGSEDDESDDEGGRRNLLTQLDKADKYDDGEPISGLMKMKFMQKAEAAKKQANDEMIAQIRRDLDSDAGEGSEDEAEEVGRRKYGGAQSTIAPPALAAAQAKKQKSKGKDKAAGGSGNGNDDDDSTLALAWEGPDGAAQLNSGHSITADSTAPKGDAWSSGLSAKKKSKKSASSVVETINTADVFGASSARPKSKSKSKSNSNSTAVVVSNGTGADEEQDDDSDSDTGDTHLPLAIRDVAQLDRAFAGDDVVVDFDAEKALLAEEQDDKVIDETLPGWGSWVGEGVSAKERARHKGRFLRTVEGTKKKDRKDAKLDKVIINEKRIKNNDKYLASQLPHPFESRAQYERSLRLPMGPEWMTKESFQEATKPRVMMKQGIIAPMSRPTR